MSNSPKHFPPRKRQGRDEDFDFLVTSPTKPTKLAELSSKQVCPRAMPPIKSAISSVVSPPTSSSHRRPISSTFKGATAVAHRSTPPCPHPYMPSFKPSKAVSPPPRFVSPRGVAPIKNPPKVALTSPPAHDNTLLAGYMAHEFLTKGTLFGQLYDPTQANTPPSHLLASSSPVRTMNRYSHGYVDKRQEMAKLGYRYVDKDKGKLVEQELEPKSKPTPNMAESQLDKNQRYADVSELLKNGAHVPGIVNPSQLARFLNL